MPPFLFVSLQNRNIFRFDFESEPAEFLRDVMRNIDMNARKSDQTICFDIAKTPSLTHDLKDSSRSCL